MHLVIRTLKSFRRNNVHVTVRSLVEEGGLSFQVASRRTYSRYLNELGYYYFSSKESFDEFSVRVLEAFGNIPLEIIDKTISSMNRRITAILASKGERIKY